MPIAGSWSFKHTKVIKVHGALSSNDGHIVLGWVLGGHGILIRSEWDLAKYLDSGRLRIVLPEFTLPATDLFVHYSSCRNHPGAGVHRFSGRAFPDAAAQGQASKRLAIAAKPGAPTGGADHSFA